MSLSTKGPNEPFSKGSPKMAKKKKSYKFQQRVQISPSTKGPNEPFNKGSPKMAKKKIVI